MSQLLSAVAVMEWECQRDSPRVQLVWCLWTRACVGREALFAVWCWWLCSVLSRRTGRERRILSPAKTRSQSQLSFSIKPEELHCSHSPVYQPVTQKDPVVVVVIHFAFPFLLDAWLHSGTEIYWRCHHVYTNVTLSHQAYHSKRLWNSSPPQK